MDASQTELDTFKVMSNNDFVDWSRAEKPPMEVIVDSPVRSRTPSPPPSSRSSRHSSPRDVPLPRSPSPPPPAPRMQTPPQSPRPAPIPQSADIPKRQMPQAKKYTAAEENEDYEILAEKEALLQDLLQLEQQLKVRLTRHWNVHEHTLDEMQFEYDRIQSEQNANQMVDMAKTGIKFGVGALEMMMKQAGFQAVDGWTQNSCKDMTKYNRPLLRLYKRYWRKTTMSPLMELGFLMFGGLAWTIAENKMGLRPSSAPANAPSAPRATSWEPPKEGVSMKPPSMMKPPSLGTLFKPADVSSNQPKPAEGVSNQPIQVEPSKKESHSKSPRSVSSTESAVRLRFGKLSTKSNRSKNKVLQL